MARTIQADGRTVTVPDDATPDEINQIFGPAPAAAKPPIPAAAPPGNTIRQAPAPGEFERLRNTVANSAVGHSLESTLPKVSHALGLTPTETVNSPTFESDKQQMLAPQYVRPDYYTPSARGRFGNVANGTLTATGNLTSGKSMASAAGLAATGGLAAPLAPVATGLKAAGLGMGAAGVGSGLLGAHKAYSTGDTAGGDEQMGETIPNAAMMLPAAHEGALRVPEMARRFVAGDINQPMAGESAGTTPATRYAAAKRLGVQPNAADATDAMIPKIGRMLTQYGLLSGPVFDARGAENIGLLRGAMNDELTGMSPLSGEAARTRQLGLLKENQEGLHNQAQGEFKDVGENYGHLPVKNVGGLAKVAKGIQRENAPFNDLFPSMESRKVGGIVNDFARLSARSRPAPANFLDAPGSEFRVPGLAPASGRVPTIGDVIAAKTGAMDFYRNNPEITKSASDADLERLVQAAHESVHGSLPVQGRASWLRGNDIWKDMKATYDNPQSPFYHAIRGNSPGSLTEGIGGTSPEALRAMRGRVGNEGMGIVRRGVTENLLGNDATGASNFTTFGRKYYAMPAEDRGALFGSGQQRLEDIAQTGRMLTRDFNPSGTAKMGVPIGQASTVLGTLAGGHPMAAAGEAGLIGAQYPVAKLMNSPKVVDWLMTPKGGRGPLPLLPAAAGAGVLAGQRRDSKTPQSAHR